MIAILLIVLFIIFNFFLIAFLKKLDQIAKKCLLISKESYIIKFMCFLVPPLFLFSFIMGNYLTSGALFKELFYKLESDFSMDFHVFLSESVLYKECYIDNSEGFNPPLIKIISLFLYRSLPEDYQILYAESAINNPFLDIRLLVQAMFPFIIMVVVSITLLGLLIYHYKNGNTFEKCYYAFLTLTNIGIIFAIERGNYILLSLPLSFFFIMTYQSKDKLCQELGLIALGIASGLKVYPCLLGIVLIKDKRWRSAIHAIFYGILFIFGPFIYYGGLNGLLGFINSLKGTGGTDSLRIGTLNISSFYYTTIQLLGFVESKNDIYIFKYFSYMLFILSLFCIFAYKESWKTITMIVTLIILYAGTAHTYMLCFLIIPMFLFINENRTTSLTNYFYAILFIILSSIIVIPAGQLLESVRLESERFTILMLIQQFSIIFLFTFLLSDGFLAIFNKIRIKFSQNKN